MMWDPTHNENETALLPKVSPNSYKLIQTKFPQNYITLRSQKPMILRRKDEMILIPWMIFLIS